MNAVADSKGLSARSCGVVKPVQSVTQEQPRKFDIRLQPLQGRKYLDEEDWPLAINQGSYISDEPCFRRASDRGYDVSSTIFTLDLYRFHDVEWTMNDTAFGRSGKKTRARRRKFRNGYETVRKPGRDASQPERSRVATVVPEVLRSGQSRRQTPHEMRATVVGVHDCDVPGSQISDKRRKSSSDIERCRAVARTGPLQAV